MIRRALATLPIRRVVVIPAGRPPHKRAELAAPEHRLAMARLAFAGMPEVSISSEEVDLGGFAYTVDTVERHRRSLSAAEPLFWLIGADSIPQLPTWKDHHRLLALCSLASFPRRGFSLDDLDHAGLDFTPAERAALRRWHIGGPLVDISATEIRRKIRAGESVSGLVRDTVLDHVEAHGLYREPS
jgi:nicotinate-nucleotide adenylyltransferase